MRRIKKQTYLEWSRKASLVKCYYNCDPKDFLWYSSLIFLFGDFYPCLSAISEHPFAEMPFSVSKTPRLTHLSLGLYSQLEKVAFFVVISRLRRRALSPGGLYLGTWDINCVLLQGQNKIPSIHGHPHCPAKLGHWEKDLALRGHVTSFIVRTFLISPFPPQDIFFPHILFFMYKFLLLPSFHLSGISSFSKQSSTLKCLIDSFYSSCLL